MHTKRFVCYEFFSTACRAKKRQKRGLCTVLTDHWSGPRVLNPDQKGKNK